jgi:hypothetical protein
MLTKLRFGHWSILVAIILVIFAILSASFRVNSFKEKVETNIENRSGLNNIETKFDKFIYKFAICGYFREDGGASQNDWERFLYIDDHSHTIDGINLVPDQPLLIIGNDKIQSSPDIKYCEK